MSRNPTSYMATMGNRTLSQTRPRRPDERTADLNSDRIILGDFSPGDLEQVLALQHNALARICHSCEKLESCRLLAFRLGEAQAVANSEVQNSGLPIFQVFAISWLCQCHLASNYPQSAQQPTAKCPVSNRICVFSSQELLQTALATLP